MRLSPPLFRFLIRNPTAVAVYQLDRMAVAQAGLIMVGVGNGLTVIFMGLYEVRSEEAQKCACSLVCLSSAFFCSALF